MPAWWKLGTGGCHRYIHKTTHSKVKHGVKQRQLYFDMSNSIDWFIVNDKSVKFLCRSLINCKRSKRCKESRAWVTLYFTALSYAITSILKLTILACWCWASTMLIMLTIIIKIFYTPFLLCMLSVSPGHQMGYRNYKNRFEMWVQSVVCVHRGLHLFA